MRTLAGVRDLLMPGLVSIESETGKNLDLAVDYSNDSIILLSSAGPKVLFTRKDIDDWVVPVEFRQRVKTFIE
jgi:hypothetical protein